MNALVQLTEREPFRVDRMGSIHCRDIAVAFSQPRPDRINASKLTHVVMELQSPPLQRCGGPACPRFNSVGAAHPRGMIDGVRPITIPESTPVGIVQRWRRASAVGPPQP